MISSPVLLSRFPVGSSARRSDGCVTSARAMATRCRWPPESSAGRWVMRSESCTASVMGRLYQRHPCILEEPDRLAQEPAHRHVVGVEDRDQLAVREGQRVVQVAGLGMAVVGPGQIPALEAPGQLLDLRAPAVVEHVDLLARVVDGEGADHRSLEDVEGLVVGGDEHVHGGLRAGDRGRARVDLDRLEIAEQKDHETVGLGPEQQQRDRRVSRVVQQQRRGDPPVEVAHGGEAAQEHDQRPEGGPQAREKAEADEGEGDLRLLPRRQRHHHQRVQHRQRHRQRQRDADRRLAQTVGRALHLELGSQTRLQGLLPGGPDVVPRPAHRQRHALGQRDGEPGATATEDRNRQAHLPGRHPA